MGCGQSQIGIIYPRKSKHKEGTKKSGEGCDEDEEDKDGDSDAEAEARLRAERLRQLGPTNPSPGPPAGPLLAHMEISSSQNDFFKMLDEKIERGPDYDSENEREVALEQARRFRLLRDWEIAKARQRSRIRRWEQHNGGPPRAQCVVTCDSRGRSFRTELA